MLNSAWKTLLIVRRIAKRKMYAQALPLILNQRIEFVFGRQILLSKAKRTAITEWVQNEDEHYSEEQCLLVIMI